VFEKTSQVIKPRAKEAVTLVLGGSSALVGDSTHSATDVVGSADACLWLAGKKYPSFPFGLYKAETPATLFTSIAVILTGYEVGMRALLGPNILPDVRKGLHLPC
jgi:divalent metal cation (Fe/Co/Zn/Cd) transporter